jgi:hypothetical protein
MPGPHPSGASSHNLSPLPPPRLQALSRSILSPSSPTNFVSAPPLEAKTSPPCTALPQIRYKTALKDIGRGFAPAELKAGRRLVWIHCDRTPQAIIAHPWPITQNHFNAQNVKYGGQLFGVVVSCILPDGAAHVDGTKSPLITAADLIRIFEMLENKSYSINERALVRGWMKAFKPFIVHPLGFDSAMLHSRICKFPQPRPTNSDSPLEVYSWFAVPEILIAIRTNWVSSAFLQITIVETLSCSHTCTVHHERTFHVQLRNFKSSIHYGIRALAHHT